MEVLIQIDPDASGSFQQQIVEQIVYLINVKRVLPDDRLPSSRALSEQLQLSRNTVKGAYEKLFALGYIQFKLGSGTYVSQQLPDAAIYVSDTLKKTSKIKTERSVGGRFSYSKTPTSQVYHREYNQAHLDFQIERTDPSSFPTKAWRRIIDHRLGAARVEMTRYVDPAGLPELRTAIASRLGLTRGMSVDPDEVLIVTGIQQGLNIIAHMFIQNAETQAKIGIEAPGFSGASFVFENYGAELKPLAVDEEGVIVNELSNEKLDVAMITPSRHFPLCSTLSLERRKGLLEWANNLDTCVLEVDYDSEFRYEDTALPALKSFDTEQRVIYLSSFTKSIGPGMRIGYMIVPQHMMHLAMSCKTLLDYGMPWLEQATLADFLNSGSFEQHLRGLRQLYLSRRNSLLSALAAEFGDVDVRGKESGTFVVWKLPAEFPNVEILKAKASEKNVGIYTLKHHTIYAPSSIENDQRIALLGYAAMTEAQINQAISNLASCI